MAPGSDVQVVAALLTRGQRILVQRRPVHKPQPLVWEFPGGKIEAGEAPDAALRRECFEELGVDVVVRALAWETRHTYREGTVHLRLYWSRLACEAGEPRAIWAKQLAWCAPAQLPQLDFIAADAPVVQALATGALREDG